MGLVQYKFVGLVIEVGENSSQAGLAENADSLPAAQEALHIFTYRALFFPDQFDPLFSI